MNLVRQEHVTRWVLILDITRSGCPAGAYCAAQSGAPVECPVGYWCPPGSTKPQACPAKHDCCMAQKEAQWYESKKKNKQICMLKFLTVAVTVYCCNMLYTHSWQRNHLVFPGSTAGAVPQKCPAGYFCPEKTRTPMLCPPHHFCPEDSSEPQLCPGGYRISVERNWHRASSIISE